MKVWENYLKTYLRARPLFLSVLRAKEAFLYRNFLPLKQPVLDFGCGDGFFAKIAFSHKSKIQNPKSKFNENIIDVGLDIRESRIKEAKAQGIYKKILMYDGKVIPFKKGSFATVVSNSVLEHVSDLDQALSEISRILKPKGKFLTTVMAGKWEDYLIGTKLIGKSYKDYMRKKQAHINLLTRIEWDNKFKKSGFRIVRTIGHFDKFSSGLIDFLHYVSIPSLISYKLTGKWVILPFLAEIIYPKSFLIKMTKNNVSPDSSAALFYELEKVTGGQSRLNRDCPL